MIFPFIANLCYIFNDKNEVLLQCKSRGFGVGKWNGPGGKQDKGETIKEATSREIKEETGVIVRNLKKMGELEFVFVDNEESNFLTHVFICNDWEGEPKDMGEGELRWFKD